MIAGVVDRDVSDHAALRREIGRVGALSRLKAFDLVAQQRVQEGSGIASFDTQAASRGAGGPPGQTRDSAILITDIRHATTSLSTS